MSEVLSDPSVKDSNALTGYANQRELASSEDDAFLDAYFAENGVNDEQVQPTPATPEEDGNSFMEHVSEIIPSVGSGLIKAAQETGNLVIDAADMVENFAAENGIGSGDLINEGSRVTAFSNPSNVFQPETMTGQIVSSISQFMFPMGAASKITKGVKTVSRLGKLAKAGAIGAAVDFSAFDPHEERLSNLIEQNPMLANPVSAFLATNPKDTAMEGRFKNAVEGMGIGTMTDTFLASLKAVRQSRVFQNVLKESDELLRKINSKGVEIPEGAADLPEEAKLLKQEIKDARPTKVEVPEKTPVLQETEQIEGSLSLDEVKDEKSMEKALNLSLDEATRGKISEAQTKEMAARLGVSEEDFLTKSPGVSLNAENMTKMRTYLDQSANSVIERAKIIKSGEATNVDRAAFLNAVTKHSAMQIRAKGFAAEAGRALKSLQFTVGADAAANNRMLNQIVKSHGGDTSVDRMAALMLEGGSDAVKNVDRMSRKSFGRKLKDVAFETWINGLLSGPKTHLVNIASNVSAIAGDLVETSLARGSAVLRGADDSIAAGEIQARFAGMIDGMKDGFKVAQETMKTGVPTDKLTKLDYPQQRALSADNFESNLSNIENESVRNAVGKSMDVMGNIFTFPGRLLTTSDDFFKAVNYRMELHSQSMRESVREGTEKGLTEVEIQDLFNGKISEPSDAIQTQSVNKSRENTFTKPVEELDLPFNAEGLKDFITKTPILRAVAPFINTNLNLVEYALNRTPFAQNLLGDIRAGGVRKDMALARVSLGTTVMGITSVLAVNGNLTGRGPANPTARKMRELAGWQPYSIKIGGEWFAYDRLDPWGGIIAMAADGASIFSSIDDSRDQERGELALQMAALVGNFMSPEFATNNIADFLSFMEGNDTRRLKNFITNLGGTAIPLSQFFKTVRKGADPIRRDTRADPESQYPIFQEFTNKIRNSIPGLSDDLPAAKNIWGEDVAYNTGFGPDNTSPIASIKADSKIVNDEIVRLGMSGFERVKTPKPGESHLLIDMPERSIRKGFAGKMEAIPLSPEQYSRYSELSAGIGLDNSPFPGRTLKETITEQVKNDYPLLGSMEKTDEAKRLIIKKVVSAYRASAKAQLLEDEPTLYESIKSKSLERIKAFELED